MMVMLVVVRAISQVTTCKRVEILLLTEVGILPQVLPIVMETMCQVVEMESRGMDLHIGMVVETSWLERKETVRGLWME